MNKITKGVAALYAEAQAQIETWPIEEAKAHLGDDDVVSRQQKLGEQIERLVQRIGRARTKRPLTRNEALELPVLRALKVQVANRVPARPDEAGDSNVFRFDLG